MKTLFTSESVTEGHPDKVCDQIADAVLDAILEKDPTARVACECCATTGLVLVMGEISTNSYISIADIARQKIREIGYDNAACGFDGNACAVMVSVDEQSPDIAMGVNDALEGRAEHRLDIGAGDQGMMFGYACDETPEYMPMAIALAHRVTISTASPRPRPSAEAAARPMTMALSPASTRSIMMTWRRADNASGVKNSDIWHPCC